jgi:hypothetical protein
MDLGRDLYPTELDELVEKEIASVIMKNEERKKKKGKEKTKDIPAAGGNDLEDRLLFLEDFVDKWAEKLEIWDSMITESEEGALNEPVPGRRRELRKDVPLSGKIPSKVCISTDDLGKEEESIYSNTNDASNAEANSEEGIEVCPEKSAHAERSPNMANVLTRPGVADEGASRVRSQGNVEVQNDASGTLRAEVAEYVL